MVVRTPEHDRVESPPTTAIDAGVIEDARARQRRHRSVGVASAVLAAGVVAFALASGGGGHSAATRHATAPRPVPLASNLDARWSALQRCLSTREKQKTVGNGLDHLPGTVRLISASQLRVFADPLPGYDGFVGAFTNEGTFAQAEKAAKGIKKQRHALGGVGTAAGLAIGNVAYYFTGWASTPERMVMTGCLVATYAGQPRWPANINPISLATWSGLPGP